MITEQDLIRFVYREARLLDEKDFDSWYELFTEDAYYWVPLSPEQTDPIGHTSIAYEDKLLLKLRIERLKSPRAYSQQPPSRCHHLLQMPEVEQTQADSGPWLTRTQFLYTEAQGDQTQTFAGTVFHTLVLREDALRMQLKRVVLVNCDAALPSIQLFI